MQNSPLQQRPAHQNLSASDEDLVLFQEVEKRESEAALPPLHQRGPDVAPPGSAALDIFSSSEWDKHDYDWLMTPPATSFLSSQEQNASYDNGSSLNESVTVKKVPTPIAKVGSSKPESSRGKPLAQASRRSFDVHRPSNPSSGPASSVSRKSLSAGTRSSTPTRSSTSVSQPMARSSTPIRSVPSGASKSTPSATSVPTKTATARAASPSNRSASSTRPLTPIKRSATPTRVNGPSLASVKPASVNKTKTSALPVKSVSSMRQATRAQVPATHPAVLQEEAPPNVRFSVAGRPLSNPRGSLASRHNSSTAVANKAAPPRSADVGSRDRGSSRAAMVARGRVSSNSLDMEKSSSRQGKPHDAAIISMSHGADSKVPGKNVPPRKPISSSQRERHAAVDTSAKKAVQPTSPHDRKPASTPRQSSGFGRNLSRKSLDMALRHMDIGGDTTHGVPSFMSNVPTSSLYSVRSRNGKATSGGHGTLPSSRTRLPMATISNASSEQGLRVIIDLEGSELGDETSSSRTSPGSQPDPSMATCNDQKVSCWLGSPDYMDDDGAEMMKNFEQELASVSGTDSPLGSIDCGDFTLEP